MTLLNYLGKSITKLALIATLTLSSALYAQNKDLVQYLKKESYMSEYTHITEFPTNSSKFKLETKYTKLNSSNPEETEGIYIYFDNEIYNKHRIYGSYIWNLNQPELNDVNSNEKSASVYFEKLDSKKKSYETDEEYMYTEKRSALTKNIEDVIRTTEYSSTPKSLFELFKSTNSYDVSKKRADKPDVKFNSLASAIEKYSQETKDFFQKDVESEKIMIKVYAEVTKKKSVEELTLHIFYHPDKRDVQKTTVFSITRAREKDEEKILRGGIRIYNPGKDGRECLFDFENMNLAQKALLFISGYKSDINKTSKNADIAVYKDLKYNTTKNMEKFINDTIIKYAPLLITIHIDQKTREEIENVIDSINGKK
ncbi:MAG: hypothetical protein KJ583_06605 [Nanoarchaeota archaeon]|nr:hypothetical protein [Nanoarchaeota archaeon]MBU1269061.1 hypothetical protein [Nanoarchaeota archaeon]MBU1604956.1 hypothetical protein [Nanoarchaeota archaeon]MBU2443314.1 hypothetical protein [Nanoarchaeota archaeon]